MEGAEARRKSLRKESSKVVKMEGSCTFGCSRLASNGFSSSFCCAGTLVVSQVHCSPELLVRAFFDCGESEGVNGLFSPRDTVLLSVSAADVAELDIRLAEYSMSDSGVIIAGDADGESSTNGFKSPFGSVREYCKAATL